MHSRSIHLNVPPAEQRKAIINERISALYLAQAQCREHFWVDFRIEMELVGAQLRRLRQRREYRLEMVAKFLRIPAARLYKIECGTYRHFQLCHLQRLSALYGTTPEAILSIIPGTSFAPMRVIR